MAVLCRQQGEDSGSLQGCYQDRVPDTPAEPGYEESDPEPAEEPPSASRCTPGPALPASPLTHLPAHCRPPNPSSLRRDEAEGPQRSGGAPRINPFTVSVEGSSDEDVPATQPVEYLPTQPTGEAPSSGTFGESRPGGPSAELCVASPAGGSGSFVGGGAAEGGRVLISSWGKRAAREEGSPGRCPGGPQSKRLRPESPLQRSQRAGKRDRDGGEEDKEAPVKRKSTGEPTTGGVPARAPKNQGVQCGRGEGGAEPAGQTAAAAGVGSHSMEGGKAGMQGWPENSKGYEISNQGEGTQGGGGNVAAVAPVSASPAPPAFELKFASGKAVQFKKGGVKKAAALVRSWDEPGGFAAELLGRGDSCMGAHTEEAPPPFQPPMACGRAPKQPQGIARMLYGLLTWAINLSGFFVHDALLHWILSLSNSGGIICTAEVRATHRFWTPKLLAFKLESNTSRRGWMPHKGAAFDQTASKFKDPASQICRGIAWPGDSSTG